MQAQQGPSYALLKATPLQTKQSKSLVAPSLQDSPRTCTN